MTTEYTPRERALKRIADSIAEHQTVQREDGPGSTCRNRACKGVIFLTLNDRYNHQAVVLANDLQRALDWRLEDIRSDAADEGREPDARHIADAYAEQLVLAPAPAPAPAPDADLDRQLRQAQADALIAAAEDVHSRGDIGKDDGTDPTGYLTYRARKILDGELFEFPHGAETDARLSTAVNTFRRGMAREGVLTAIRPVRSAMIEALAAADEEYGAASQSDTDAEPKDTNE